MKSKKRQNGGIKKPNIFAIFICLALVLLLFGGGGAAIYNEYNKSSNKLPAGPNYEPGDPIGPFGSNYINHLSNIYRHEEEEVEQDYYMAENEN